MRRRRTTPHENSFSEDIVGEFDVFAWHPTNLSSKQAVFLNSPTIS